MRAVPLAPLFFCALTASCRTGRGTEAWIASRDPEGRIVAGATVEVDGQDLGLTDERGLFKLKLDNRKPGDRVRVSVYRQALSGEPATEAVWQIEFTVGTDGRPVEGREGWLTAVLEPGKRK